MKRILTSCLMLITLFLIVSPSSADVAPISLEKLIKVSKRAVITTVVKLLDVEGVKIAEAKVLMTLKGTPTADRLYFVAQPTSMENTSRAVVGERVLLFLEPEPPGFKEPSPFRIKLHEAIGDHQLWLISWSGRGRLPIQEFGQAEYIPVLADAKLAEVQFPRAIDTIPSPDSKGSIRLARLDEVVKFIKRKVRRNR